MQGRSSRVHKQEFEYVQCSAHPLHHLIWMAGQPAQTAPPVRTWPPVDGPAGLDVCGKQKPLMLSLVLLTLPSTGVRLRECTSSLVPGSTPEEMFLHLLVQDSIRKC